MKIQYPSSIDPYRAALVHHQKKEYAEAKKLYLAVLQRQPQRAEAWVNLASVCDALGERVEALSHAERALALNPEVRDGYFNKGAILYRLQRFEEAIEAFQMSLKFSPNDHDAYYHIGQCYFSLCSLDLALAAYKQASDIRPTFASIYAAGRCYQDTSRLLAAVVCFNECIKIKPGDKNTQFKLLDCYQKQRDYPKLKEILFLLKAAGDLDFAARQLLFFIKQELSFWSDVETDKAQLVTAIESNSSEAFAVPIDVWKTIMLPISLSSRLRLAKRAVSAIEERFLQPMNYPIQPRTHNRPLRIAYFSMDFRVHPVGLLIESALPLHDRTRFEVYAYSFGLNDNSEVRKAIEQGVDHFVDIYNMSIPDSVKRIVADGIDILIDLGGFTADNRFEILALRPAPIQVSYLGYCLTSGSQAIDYFLGDKTVIPAVDEPHYSEKIAYLPHTFMVLNHKAKICTELARTRDYWHLPETAFVYGCFNGVYKIEPTVFGLWMEILQAVPNSVLWLFSHHEMINENLRLEASKRGVDPQRLIFTPFVDHAEHLARHLHMDLFLDTLQFNAVTTACHAIYTGVPILTLAGDHVLSRACSSFMQAAGPAAITQQFIATNKADYKQKAINFGLHPQEFALLKKAFQEELPQSHLLDIPARVKAIEAAYEKMWALHQQGLAPQTFSIS